MKSFLGILFLNSWRDIPGKSWKVAPAMLLQLLPKFSKSLGKNQYKNPFGVIS